jgi:hypothetical protein
MEEGAFNKPPEELEEIVSEKPSSREYFERNKGDREVLPTS